MPDPTPHDHPYGRPALVFPPDLVPVVRASMRAHPALRDVPPEALCDLLSTVFLAALATVEHLHEPIHVAFLGRRAPVDRDPPGAVPTIRFRRPFQYRTVHLLRLARASAAQRLFTIAHMAGDQLLITGMAPGSALAPDDALLVAAPMPGHLEVWHGAKRVVEYAQGRIRHAPEGVLLSKGPVWWALRGFAGDRDPDGYLALVGALVRRLGAHGHGGILVISAQLPVLPEDEAYVVDAGRPLTDLLAEARRASDDRLREFLYEELRRTLDDIGHTTALDGATVLDRALGLRAFGVLLPTSGELRVVEAQDPEAVRQSPLSRRHGARHRAAASHAWSHPGDVVFVASSDGGIGCLLRPDPEGPALLWREVGAAEAPDIG